MEEETNITGRLIRIGLNEYGKIYKERIEKPDHYVYAIASGGFGCFSHKMGNAIFTEFEGNSERDCLNKLALNINKSDRWEKYWQNIEVADMPEGQILPCKE